MKNILFITAFFFLTAKLSGQTQGISYQAIIIDQNAQEIAGVDASGVILPNRAIKVRFTILDAAGTIDYQEEQATTTDAYGMINLTIGRGIATASSLKSFTEIDWSGDPKELKVDISISQTDVFYTDFSLQELTFIPYAFHKNITATGTLNVNEKSTLRDLSVEASANLNGSLDVNNLSPTHLSGILSVDQNTTLRDTLTVNSASNLNGQVIITADISSTDDLTTGYPLYVKGSNQGIAIKVNGSRNNSNNFVTFWDGEGIQGRIEGESTSEIKNDPTYIYENLKLVFDAGVAVSELIAASTSSSPCIGLVPCVTTPSFSEIAFAVAQLALATTDITLYNTYRWANAGVAYQSRGADYAEYLPRLNSEEKIFPGDIIGVKGGYVSRNTQNCDKVMVVSQKPIVLGNMPNDGMEGLYEKIAFLGQVQAKVIGKVNIGDYIIPSGNNDGTGIAVSPDNMQPTDYLNSAGVAWTASQSDIFGYVNVAVGLNTADIVRLNQKHENKIKEQTEEIKMLKEQLNRMNAVLAQLVPEYSELMGIQTNGKLITQSDSFNIEQKSLEDIQQYVAAQASDSNYSVKEGQTIVYYEITREHINEGLKVAQQILARKGNSNNYPLLSKIESDPEFREAYINELLTSVKKKMDESYKQDIKSGATVIKDF